MENPKVHVAPVSSGNSPNRIFSIGCREESLQRDTRRKYFTHLTHSLARCKRKRDSLRKPLSTLLLNGNVLDSEMRTRVVLPSFDEGLVAAGACSTCNCRSDHGNFRLVVFPESFHAETPNSGRASFARTMRIRAEFVFAHGTRFRARN